MELTTFTSLAAGDTTVENRDAPRRLRTRKSSRQGPLDFEASTENLVGKNLNRRMQTTKV